MEIIILNNDDVRKYGTLSKQVRDDLFNQHARQAQQVYLNELIGGALYYELVDNLTNNWTTEATNDYTRNSDTQFTINGVDATSLSGQALKVNSDYFYTVVSAVYDLTNTIVIVKGFRSLPQTISTLEYKAETKHIKLLNGETYTDGCGDTVFYYGLYPYLSYYFLNSFNDTGSLKHGEQSNATLTDQFFTQPDPNLQKRAKDNYLTSAQRYGNTIIDYICQKSTDFPNADTQPEQTIKSFDFSVH